MLARAKISHPLQHKTQWQALKPLLDQPDRRFAFDFKKRMMLDILWSLEERFIQTDTTQNSVQPTATQSLASAFTLVPPASTASGVT